MAASNLTLEDRFWSKVLKTDTCWLWQRQRNNKGYGCFSSKDDSRSRPWTNVFAHRMAWILTFGPIPSGLNVLHRCDRPACVNPFHLFLGTQHDNMADCSKKGRIKIQPYRAKVSHEQIRAIRIDTRKHHIIAKEYGLGRRTVLAIKHRESWKNVI